MTFGSGNGYYTDKKGGICDPDRLTPHLPSETMIAGTMARTRD